MSKYDTSNEGFTLSQLLDFKTVAQLKEIALLLGFSYKSGTRKAQIVNHLSDLLLREPERLIHVSYLYELEMYKDIIDGNMTAEYAEKSGILFDYNRFGLVYSVIHKASKEESLHFEKELGEKIRPLIQPEIDKRKQVGGDIVEKVAIGCANIYGYTDLFYLMSYLPEIERRIGHDFDKESLMTVMTPWYCQTYDGKENTNPILSPFASLNGFYPDDDHLTYEEPKKYDLDTIMKFGEMPYPVIAIKETDKLKAVLEEYGNPLAGTPDEVIRQLWIEKQDDRRSTMPDFSKYFVFHDIDQLNECTMATMEFLNHVPYWRLNGNSSADIGRRERAQVLQSGRMPQIVIGPNMRKMGIESFEQLLEMAERGQDFPFAASDGFDNWKVGRNDPCPCGSGKKYKHCCGK